MSAFLVVALLAAKEPYVRLPRKTQAHKLALGHSLSLRLASLDQEQELLLTGPADLYFSATRRGPPVHVLLHEPGAMQELIDLWNSAAVAGAISIDAGPHDLTIVADGESLGSVVLSLLRPGSAVPTPIQAPAVVALPPPKEPAADDGASEAAADATPLVPRGRVAPDLLPEHGLSLWPMKPGRPLRFSVRGKDALHVSLYRMIGDADPARWVARIDGRPLMSALVGNDTLFELSSSGAKLATPDDYDIDLPPGARELVLTTSAAIAILVSAR